MLSAYAHEHPSSRTTLEEIDGLLLDMRAWQAFVIECKNWKSPVDFEKLAKFQLAIERRPMGTLGLFFSPEGYTEPAIELFKHDRPIRVLLFDRKDLKAALETKNLLGIVRAKWKLAVRDADPYLAVGDRPTEEGKEVIR